MFSWKNAASIQGIRMRTKQRQPLLMPSSLISVANTSMRTSSCMYSLTFVRLIYFSVYGTCLGRDTDFSSLWLHRRSSVLCICVSLHIFAVYRIENKHAALHSLPCSSVLFLFVACDACKSVEMYSMRFSSQCSEFNEMILMMSEAIKRRASFKYTGAEEWWVPIANKRKEKPLDKWPLYNYLISMTLASAAILLGQFSFIREHVSCECPWMWFMAMDCNNAEPRTPFFVCIFSIGVL